MDVRKEFTDREKAAYEPGPCPKGHARRKQDVDWVELPRESNFVQVQRMWLIQHENCPVCSRPPVEEGDEWRDEIE